MPVVYNFLRFSKLNFKIVKPKVKPDLENSLSVKYVLKRLYLLEGKKDKAVFGGCYLIAGSSFQVE